MGNGNEIKGRLDALRAFMAGQGWHAEAIDFTVEQLLVVYLADRQADEVAAMDFGEQLTAYGQSVQAMVANKDEHAALLGRHATLSAALVAAMEQMVVDAEFVNIAAAAGQQTEGG